MLLQNTSFFSAFTLELLLDIAFVLTVVLQLIGLYRWRQLSKTQKLVVYIVSLTLINHGATWYLMTLKKNNLWVYHAYVPLLFTCMALIYKDLLGTLMPAIIFRLILFGFLLFAVINSAFIQPINVLNSNEIRALGLLSVGFGLLYFYKLIKESPIVTFVKDPMTWFTSGVIIYYSGTMILFLLMDTVIAEEDDLLVTAWGLNAIFNILLLIAYGVTLCMKSQD